jgi:hypothetical protein
LASINGRDFLKIRATSYEVGNYGSISGIEFRNLPL